MDTTGAGVGGRVAAASVESVAAGGIEAGNGASDGYRRVASLWHTLLVVVVQGVLSYRAAVSFGKVHALVDGNRAGLYERTMVTEWVMLGVVLIGVWWHGSSLITVLGERWRSVRNLLRDVGIAVLLADGDDRDIVIRAWRGRCVGGTFYPATGADRDVAVGGALGDGGDL